MLQGLLHRPVLMPFGGHSKCEYNRLRVFIKNAYYYRRKFPVVTNKPYSKLPQNSFLKWHKKITCVNDHLEVHERRSLAAG